MPAPPKPNSSFGLAAANSTVQPSDGFLNSGLAYLSSGGSALTSGMNTIGSLLSNTFNFKDQVKAITKGDAVTYTPVGQGQSASAAPLNPLVGGIPILPLALGGVVVLGFVFLLRK
jgi:hypothetical protein